MVNTIQVKRNATVAGATASLSVLAAGEPGVALSTGEVRYGNGTDTWANLPSQAASQLTVLAPRATGSDQTASLQTAITSAATFGLWLALNGNHVINGELNLANGSRVDGTRGTITQTGSLKTGFRCIGVTNVKIRDVVANGKTTDYINSSGVYPARAVLVDNSSDVWIENCRFLGWAGAGVYLTATASDVHIIGNLMTGAGATYILNTTYNFSGGVVASTGSTRWEARGNEISEFAQGIVTGDNMEDVRITGNYIHDIISQHGIYCETVNGGVISNNLIRNTGLLGMKIQVGATTSDDADSVTISDNVFTGLGAQGILLTNPPGGAVRLRRINVTGNVIYGSPSKAIECNNCVGINIADNIIGNAAQGVSINNSSEFSVHHNRIDTTTQNGITITDCQDWSVGFNWIKNPGSQNSGTAEFGIQVAGATCADGTVRANKVVDNLGNMRYGLYFSGAADLTTIDVIDNRATGATDYGYRGIAVNARTFRGNVFAGTTGAALTLPSNFTTNPDTSGAALATLETEVNELKAVLRANGLIAS